MSKVSLAELAGAVTADKMPAQLAPGKIKSKKVRESITNRLIANEFLRNGLKIKEAYESVTKLKYTPAKFNALIQGHDQMFLREIDSALANAEVEKNKVLGILWVQATSVVFDFMDDDGNFLSIAELKKLPREVQALVEEVEMRNTFEPVKGDDGKTLKDEEGRPYMRPVSRVKLKLTSKQAALNAIAQIGKLVGPTTITQNFAVSVGQFMVDADARRAQVIRAREARPARAIIEHDPDAT